MSGTDALMWRVGRNPLTRMNLVDIWLLDAVPEWERLLDCFHYALIKAPRLTHRVVEPLFDAGPPVWSPDPGFRLTNHLSRIALPPPGDLRQILDHAERAAADELNPAHPPWDAVLIEGYESDKAALIIRWHHSLADGIGSAWLFEQLTSPTRETEQRTARRVGVEPLSEGRRVPATPLAAAAELPMRMGVSMVSAAYDTYRNAGWAFRQMKKMPTLSAQDMAQVPLRMARLLKNFNTVPGPSLPSFPRAASPSPHFEVIRIDGDALNNAARAAHAGTAAAYLAAFAAAYREYGLRNRRPTNTITVSVPVSLRRPGNNDSGNFFGLMPLRVSLDDMTVVQRMQSIHKQLMQTRASFFDDYVPVLASAGSWVPGIWVDALAPSAGELTDAVLSVVNGVRRPSFLAGAQWISSICFAPRGTSPCNATMVYHLDHWSIAVHLDPAVFTDGALFRELLEEKMGEIIQLAGAET
ncbi:WS/DGAT/MGAT family acyltransferase [Nocardia tenerifensis]|uniref:diacylglycerol O-acyltransferase n=1 Tax=Nocardia tenerifensis TaxID=228006 RepID=A0A318JVY1_9NOCA|nr:wax ester/triacylglycerol synthase domain-containing protein [Nocardia tenerifensis]PXX58102.1 WS/DGAT/MGAT family acyltransferase [Nocardia tenerifensis]